MNKKIVIAISREYGAGGKTIGEMLSEDLGIHYYDKELLKLASEESGINEALFNKADSVCVSVHQNRFTDPKYKGADSMKLLEQVRELVMDEGYVVGNVDATVIAQAPKLRPYIEQMEENVAKCLGIDVSQVNIKATTEEHLGFTGREEGISSQAVCLLYEFYDGSNVVIDTGRSCAGCAGCKKENNNE